MASVVHSGRVPRAARDRSCLFAALFLIVLVAHVGFIQGPHFALFHLRAQDLPVILGAGGLFLGLFALRPTIALPSVVLTRRKIALILGAVALALWGLTYALMGNFPISRDEHMVIFDMAVFAQGQAATPLDPSWRIYATDLVPAFLLNEDHPSALVSSYLPMNALLRLTFAQLMDPALFNPLLFAVGGMALFDIARRQFGDDHETILVTMILYLLSMQVLVNAMTTYAMTGHLALNLVWLAAFLRGGRWHLVAIAVGFVATGLHQLAFHPLFVAPFLLHRLLQGDRKLVAGYTLAYAVICAAWVAYPMVAGTLTGTSSTPGGSHTSFAERMLPLLLDRNPVTVPLMVMNVLRFFSWQHLALLPLALSALPLCRVRRSLTLPLFGGIALTLAVFALVLPYQGHGWGYRYLHGYIGSFALLGGFGYQRLRQEERGFAGALVVVTSLATIAAMAWLTTRVHAFVAPHVALEKLVAAVDADMVVIDTEAPSATLDGKWTANAVDFGRNRPDLANRPLRLSSYNMTADKVAALCARGTIAFIDRAAQKRVGFGLNQPTSSPRFEAIEASIRDEARRGRCQTVG